MITTTATINVLKNEFWDKRGDYEWTKGMVHHSTRENGISIKYSIHYIETKVGSFMVVWITFRGTVD
jgi:predicted lipase